MRPLEQLDPQAQDRYYMRVGLQNLFPEAEKWFWLEARDRGCGRDLFDWSAEDLAWGRGRVSQLGRYQGEARGTWDT